jgi:hypothetical protein
MDAVISVFGLIPRKVVAYEVNEKTNCVILFGDSSKLHPWFCLLMLFEILRMELMLSLVGTGPPVPARKGL